MGSETKIEWCDHTSSPWHGCSHKHIGCENCFAETMAKRNPATLGIWGENGTRVKSKSFIANLEKWNRLGEQEHRIHSVFPSICDSFEDRPGLEPWRREMFDAVDRLPWIRLLLLTKRPENVRGMWPLVGCKGLLPSEMACEDRRELDCLDLYRKNCWIGYSASDQATLGAGIGHLLDCADLTPVPFLSLEPLLGPIDLSGITSSSRGFFGNIQSLTTGGVEYPKRAGVKLVIVGGESGHGARPCHLDHVRSIVQQCKSAGAGVACFVKQLGSVPVMDEGEWLTGGVKPLLSDNNRHRAPDGSLPLAMADSKGGNMEAWPEELRVREMPKAVTA